MKFDVKKLDYLSSLSIKSYEKSGSVYGLSNRKKLLVGTKVSKKNIVKFESHVSSSDGIERDTILIKYHNDKLKKEKVIRFILDDIDLKFDMVPIDRTIEQGKTVYCINNKKNSLPKDTPLIISSIVKSYINEKLDLAYVELNGKIIPTFVKNLAVKCK